MTLQDTQNAQKNSLLQVRGLSVNYGAIRALQSIDLDVYEGEIVSVIGANGAGKSTLMNAVMGTVKVAGGTISFQGKPLPVKSYHRVSLGLAISPEGRKVLAPLTVLENLRMGAFSQHDKAQIAQDIEKMYTLFPRLRDRHYQYAGTLSGGEQQMLAIARALMARPKLLLLDEPSLGLAPIIIKEIFNELLEIKKMKTTILLVEQNARQAMMLSDRTYVLQTGRLVMTGASSELLEMPEIKSAYLGG